jgi:hypothetical protein
MMDSYADQVVISLVLNVYARRYANGKTQAISL